MDTTSDDNPVLLEVQGALAGDGEAPGRSPQSCPADPPIVAGRGLDADPAAKAGP